MGQQNLAYSLIFKIVDGASAKIREIAQVMAEPTAAAAALGDASEASSARQVSAFAKVKTALSDVTEAMAAPIARAAALGRAAGEAAEKFSTSFAGMGAVVAEGFSLKNVADQEEFFRRLQINTGMAKNAIDGLKESIGAAAAQYGVAKDKMLAAMDAYRDGGGDPRTFGQNAGALAATLQLNKNMDPGAAGTQLASLGRMGITDPKQVLATLAQMNAQLDHVPERMEAAAEASGRLVAAMMKLHYSGTQGALALNAVYAVAARSAGGNARVARSETEGWLNQLQTKTYRDQLSMAMGERITDLNGFVMDPRIIMQKMAAKYAAVQRLPKNQQEAATQRLNALVGDNASRMFGAVGGEIANTGRSTTLDQVLGAKGDGAQYLDDATRASNSLSGGMQRLKNAMDEASESMFTGPLNLFVDALNSCNGIVGDVVVGLAGLVAVGKGLTWAGEAATGVWRLVAALSTGLISVLGSTLNLVGRFAILLWDVAGALIPVIINTLAWAAGVIAATWPILAVIAAIALVVGGIYYLSTHWKKTWGEMPAPVKAVGEFVGGVVDKIKHWWDKAFNWIADGWKKMTDKFTLPDWVKRVFGISGGDSSGSIGSDSSSGDSSSNGGWFHDMWDKVTGHGGARGHNVGNLRNVHGAGFQSFASDEQGALAMAHQLQLYANRDHLHTVAQIVRKWAPPSENNVGAYVRDVTGRMGVGAGVHLDLDNQGTLASLMHAMIHHEQGHDVLGMDQLAAVLTQGGSATNLNAGGGGSSSQLAQGSGARLGKATHHSVLVPSTIYGQSTASTDPAPDASSGSVGGDSNPARAHLTIKIDAQGRAKTHLDHSADMEASLDRGTSMAMSWG